MSGSTGATAGREIFVLVAVGLSSMLVFAASGCLGPRRRKPETPAETLESMPPFAVSAKPHVGALAVHSFARVGADDAPSPSPDGSWLVFASTRNSKEWQLYRQSTASPVVTQLTYGPASHIQPQVSPDGREIAYAGNDSGSWDIWILPAGGGSRENLTSTRDVDEVHPAWHPSGRALVFCADRDRGPGEEWWVCARSRGGSGISWIAPGLNPDWSPKGDLIVFQRGKGRDLPPYGIWTVDISLDANGLVAGGPQSQIVSDPGWSAEEPVFSPDGERVAFVAVPLGALEEAKKGGRRPLGGDIWCVRVTGTDLVRLIATPESEWNPAWAGVPGKPGENGRVFFVSERDGHKNIWSLMPAFYVPGPVIGPHGAEDR